MFTFCQTQCILLRFSDRETDLHSVVGIRLYWGTGTGLLFNNDKSLPYLRIALVTLRFLCWTNETAASHHLRSYLVLQRLYNEAALSPGIDAFWY